jgi:prepilin-type N-terminal cleavage/methylation domain-containing protein
MNRAFSLIEVLIAIVVLALGLLGIAAVFPAVLTQQRSTTDTIQGTSLERSVRDFIRAHKDLNATSVDSDRNDVLDNDEHRGWKILLGNPDWSMPLYPEPLDASNAIFDGGFEPPGNVTTANGLSMDSANGDMYLVYGSAPTISIPTTQRLLQATSGRALYIWDFAARRLGAGMNPGINPPPVDATRPFHDDSIQIAVFIRRTDTPGPRGAVVRIAEDNNERPTFNGIGAYARIKSAQATDVTPATAPTGTGSVLRVQSPLARYLAQPNQKIVDAFGKVQHVVDAKLEDAGGTIALLTLRDRINQGDIDALVNAGQSPDFTILFTTQVPAAVSVFDIRPAPLPD